MTEKEGSFPKVFIGIPDFIKSTLPLLFLRRELKSFFPLWKRGIQGDFVFNPLS
jgi:hypothetical protein